MSARRVLILGGSGWLGRHLVSALAADGAEVVCLARGATGAVPDGARHVRADRRDPAVYRELSGDWDEVVELATAQPIVRSALEALADRAAHWSLVSTVSVYARNDEPGADETAATVAPADLDSYPDAKVAAERASRARLGVRLLVCRPGLIVGPGDPTDRFGYWPARLFRGGRVLAPVLTGRFVQIIDVRDLAAALAVFGRGNVVGVLNAVGPAVSFADMLTEISAVTGASSDILSAPDERLRAAGVNYWAGPRSLPLWIPAEDVGFAQRSAAAYLAAGGRNRPLRATVADVLTDERGRGLDRPRRAGLTAEEEAEALAAVGAGSDRGGEGHAAG